LSKALRLSEDGSSVARSSGWRSQFIGGYAGGFAPAGGRLRGGVLGPRSVQRQEHHGVKARRIAQRHGQTKCETQEIMNDNSSCFHCLISSAI
jgi:hypothetical protein